MEILKILSNYALLGAGVLVFLFFWGASLAAISASTARRGLPRVDRLFWLALGVILPLVGFGLYWLARLAGQIMTGAPQLEAPQIRDSTGTRPQQTGAPMAALPYAPAPGDTIPAPLMLTASPCCLTLVEGASPGLQYGLETLPLRIGRGAEVHIRIGGDMRVSRLHAEIYRGESGLRVRDLGSTHGTMVNGVLMSDAPLQPGDQIRVGDSILRLDCA